MSVQEVVYGQTAGAAGESCTTEEAVDAEEVARGTTACREARGLAYPDFEPVVSFAVEGESFAVSCEIPEDVCGG